MIKIKTKLKIAVRVILMFLFTCAFVPIAYAEESGYANGADETFITVSKTFSGITADAIPSGFNIQLQNENGVTLYTLINQSSENVIFTVTTNENGETVWNWKVVGLTTGTYRLVEHNNEIENYIDTVEVNGQEEDGDIDIHQADITVEIERETTNRHPDWPISETTFFVGTLTDQGVLVVSYYALTAAERVNVKAALMRMQSNVFHKDPVYYYSLEGNAGTVDVDTYPISINGKTVTYYRDITTWSGHSNHSYVRDGSGVVFSNTSIWQQTGIGTITYENGKNADIMMINIYEYNLTNIAVTKVWDDDENSAGLRPASVVVKLLANGNDTGETVTLSESNSWSDGFSDLPKYDENNEEITYTVEEIIEEGSNLDKYYNGTVAGENGNYTITNSQIPLTSVEGTKTWEDNDNKNNTRPASITINLLADGNPYTSATVIPDENENWAYSFANLPKFRDSGIPIIYTVTEEAIDDYYTEIPEGSYNIKNIYLNVTEPITITKNWITYNPTTNDVIGIVVSTLNIEGDEDIKISLSIGDDGVCTVGENSRIWNCQIELPKYHSEEDDEGNITLTPIEYAIYEESINGMLLDKNNEIHVEDKEIRKQIIGIWSSTTTGNQTTGFTIENVWTPKPTTNLNFTKVSFEDNQPLDGAVFALYKYVGDDINTIDYNNLVESDWQLISQVTSNPVSFNNLYEGTYRLVEIQAPEGCLLPSGWWMITINEDMTVTRTAINNPPNIGVDNLIYNEHVPQLPATGAKGIIDFALIGLILMALGSFTLIMNQRENI